MCVCLLVNAEVVIVKNKETGKDEEDYWATFKKISSDSSFA
jgi:hypothetical protein